MVYLVKYRTLPYLPLDFSFFISVLLSYPTTSDCTKSCIFCQRWYVYALNGAGIPHNSRPAVLALFKVYKFRILLVAWPFMKHASSYVLTYKWLKLPYNRFSSLTSGVFGRVRL